MAGREIEPELAADRGKQDDGLLEREGLADADARARAEGQIGEAVDALARTGEEARRVENLRILPEQAMPMQDPRGDHHPGAAIDLEARDAIRADRLARDRRGRRIEPQRLLDHCLGDDQAGQGRQGEIAVAQHLVVLAVVS
jgi:hypothetical protein